MCTPKSSETLTRQVIATASGYTTAFVTPWMLAAGADTIRTMLELRQLAGSLGAKVCYRTAAVRTDDPDAWSYATARSAAGIYVEDIDLSSVTDKLWVQCGLATAATSGVAEALAKLQLSMKSHGVLVASRTVQVEPSVNSSQTAFLAVGEPFPALGLSGLMFGIVVSGVDGTLNYGVAWRGIDADPARPDAWSAFSSGDAWSGVTADEARNTGILTASFGTKGFLQPGLKWSGTSATATIHIVVVALY